MFLNKTNKSPYYQIIYERNGKRTSKSTGETTKSAALKFLSEFEEKIREENRIEPITIKEYRDRYEDFIKSTKSESYLRSVQFALKKLIEYTDNILLGKLDSRIIEKFIIQTYERSPAMAGNFYRTLKAAFNNAVRWGYLRKNPMSKIKAPRIPIKKPVFINETDLQLILDKTDSNVIKDLFYLAFHTGMRLGEIINLKWNAVDMQQRIITIRNTDEFTTKSKRERIIPVNESLLKLLQKIRPKIFKINIEPYIFYKVPGIKLNGNYVSKKFKEAVRKAKLDERIHFHTLRHSFASCLIQRGISLYVVKELLGHEDLKTTQIYSHLQTENLFDAVNTLNQ